MPKTYDLNCPVARTLDLLGDRWTLLIIRDLLRGKTRFREFVVSLKGIPTNMLSERLKFLESAGIVDRTIYNDRPPRAEYSLTQKGESLHWVIDALSAWGSEHAFDKPHQGPSHTDCDHPVMLSWICTECGEPVQSASVKMNSVPEIEED